MEYYDKLLIAIPVSIGVGILTSLHPVVAFSQGLLTGSLVAIVLILDLLFRNPPEKPAPVARGDRVIESQSL